MERNFGQYLVTVKKSPCTDSFRISIAGNLNSNFGLLYTHNFERFKRDNNIQVIGMEWRYGLTNSIKKWINIASLKSNYLFIVPSGEDLKSLETNGTKINYEKHIYDLGYVLIDKSFKYKLEKYPKNLCLSPTNYYLFKKILKN